MPELEDFVRESNLIEGITRDPTDDELNATGEFLDDLTSPITIEQVCELQAVYAPGRPLRDHVGMSVRIGNYVAPMGGRTIQIELMTLIRNLNKAKPGLYDNPWQTHLTFERLHPFMDGNGRTGRTLWAWHMLRVGLDPFALSFLHRFYYQTLENDAERS